MVRKSGRYLLFNETPSRVKLTPDGIVEQYAVSPPPFVKNNQTITISNIPNIMNEFDNMTEKFAGVNGGVSRMSRPITVTPIHITPKVTTPVVPSKPAITPTSPSGGGGGGGGGSIPKADTDASTGSGVVAKVGFSDELKSHWIFYVGGILLGGAGGYYATTKSPKPDLKWLGAVGGAGVVFGLTWLYFNKASGASSKESAPVTPAVSEKPDDK